MKTILSSLRLLVVLTLLTGVLYPLAVWGVGQACFRDRAEGSLLRRSGQVVGSRWLAQKTTRSEYFQPRPSSADYATVASGASNQAWTSAALAKTMAERRAAFAAEASVPAEVLTASGSGLDAELSPEAVRLQIARVAAARRLDAARRQRLETLIAAHIRGGQFSPARLNVLELNLALAAALSQ
jgi:K+-transporting ATPase ATPase C chain